MTEQQMALARRAVACRGWRWMPGMAGTDALGVPFRCALTHHSGGIMVVAGMAVMVAHPDALAHMFPDLTDPATLGCLLALVREAWGDECVCTLPVDYGPVGVTWFCRLTAGGRDLAQSYVRGGVGEVEALVAALEAAP